MGTKKSADKSLGDKNTLSLRVGQNPVFENGNMQVEPTPAPELIRRAISSAAYVESGSEFEIDAKKSSIDYLMKLLEDISADFQEMIMEPKLLRVQLDAIYDDIKEIERGRYSDKKSVKIDYLEHNVPVKMKQIIYSQPFVAEIINILKQYFV